MESERRNAVLIVAVLAFVLAAVGAVIALVKRRQEGGEDGSQPNGKSALSSE